MVQSFKDCVGSGRLDRSLREMLDTAHGLQSRGGKPRSLTEAIETETPTGRLMFSVPTSIAKYRERTMVGLKAAPAWVRMGGRRRKVLDEDLATLRVLLKDAIVP